MATRPPTVGVDHPTVRPEDSPSVALDHPTVVPSNYDPEDH